MNERPQHPQYTPQPPPPLPHWTPPPGAGLPLPPAKPKWPLWGKLAVAGVVVVTILAVISVATYKPTGHAGAGVHSVVYQVDGTGGAISGLITFQTPDGQSQATADLPMKTADGGTLVFTNFSRGDFLYISAQNQEETGTVTCRILVDGVKVSENTGQGGYSIASCSAQANW